jgi:hypothetical protein
MRAAKPLAILLILSMLSACAAGARAPGRDLQASGDEKSGDTPTTYAEAVEAGTAGVTDQDRQLLERSAAAAARHGPRHRDTRDADYHREPSPEEKYAAEVALLLTAQIFVCSFVVVVLDGHCDFHVSAGYYYY